MNREVITDPLDRGDLWFDLRENVILFKQLGVTQPLVLFGFSWGKQIYDGPWTEQPISVDQLTHQVLEAEEKQFGKLGDDNLYIRVPEMDIRVQYSHETDIHLSYSDENIFVQNVLARWLERQWLTYGPRRAAEREND